MLHLRVPGLMRELVRTLFLVSTLHFAACSGSSVTLNGADSAQSTTEFEEWITASKSLEESLLRKLAAVKTCQPSLDSGREYCLWRHEGLYLELRPRKDTCRDEVVFALRSLPDDTQVGPFGLRCLEMRVYPGNELGTAVIYFKDDGTVVGSRSTSSEALRDYCKREYCDFSISGSNPVPPESYPVYQALLSYVSKGQSPIYLLEQTFPFSEKNTLYNEHGALLRGLSFSQEAMWHLIQTNAHPHSIEPKFPPSLNVILLNSRLFLPSLLYETEPEDFQKQYPAGVLYVSAVGFNAAKTKAIVRYAYYCGEPCGDEGRIVHLRKQHSTWKIISESSSRRLCQ